MTKTPKEYKYLDVGVECAVIEHTSNGFVGVLCSLLLAHWWSHGVNRFMYKPENVHRCFANFMYRQVVLAVWLQAPKLL